MPEHNKTLAELYEIKESVTEKLCFVDLGTHKNVFLWFAFRMVLADINTLETNK